MSSAAFDALITFGCVVLILALICIFWYVLDVVIPRRQWRQAERDVYRMTGRCGCPRCRGRALHEMPPGHPHR